MRARDMAEWSGGCTVAVDVGSLSKFHSNTGGRNTAFGALGEAVPDTSSGSGSTAANADSFTSAAFKRSLLAPTTSATL